MQIILMEKVHNLGQLGDVVKVKDGFARNFLIPQGKAKRATEKAIEEFKSRRVDLEAAHNKTLALAQERAGKLEGLMIQIAQKAGHPSLLPRFVPGRIKPRNVHFLYSR